MHTTDSVDYVLVLDGEVWLELDDGELTRLRAGDTVIQNGTRHAWRNQGTESVTLAVWQVRRAATRRVVRGRTTRWRGRDVTADHEGAGSGGGRGVQARG